MRQENCFYFFYLQITNKMIILLIGFVLLCLIAGGGLFVMSAPGKHSAWVDDGDCTGCVSGVGSQKQTRTYTKKSGLFGSELEDKDVLTQTIECTECGETAEIVVEETGTSGTVVTADPDAVANTNGAFSEWSVYGECVDNKQKRTRLLTDGTANPEDLTESRDCPVCDVLIGYDQYGGHCTGTAPTFDGYTLTTGRDIAGSNIYCSHDPTQEPPLTSAQNAEHCKDKCDTNTSCKGFTYLNSRNAGGVAGCCTKSSSNIHASSQPNVNVYTKEGAYKGYTTMNDTDGGVDIQGGHIVATDPQVCATACTANSMCKAFNSNGIDCYLKSTVGNESVNGRDYHIKIAGQ